jgi:uncharacterized membrane protein YfcA
MIWLDGIEADLGPSFFALMVIVFVAGIIRGFTGFGSALLAVPALAVLFGPAQAIVIEVLIEIPVMLSLIPTAIRDAQRKTVLPILAMFVIFVPFGALLLNLINPEVVKIVISLFVLVAVGLMWQQRRLSGMFSPKATFLVGAISGTAQGLTGMAGPIFVTALVARGESATRTRANIATLAGGIIIVSAISFWAFGMMTKEIVTYAVLASPAILLGMWTGSVLFRRFSHQNLRGIILGFLALTALVTLYQSLS